MSQFRTTLTPDAPVASASAPFDATARQELDARAIASQLFLEECLIAGVTATWIRVDSASPALAKGDVVASATSSALAVTFASPTALLESGSPLGVVLRAAAPGALALIAVGGLVSPSVTGLAAGAAAAVRVTAGRAEAAAGGLVGGDYRLGTVDAGGWLTLGGRGTMSSTLAGTAGVAGASGASVTVSGGAAGDAAHKRGDILLDLGLASSGDSLTSAIRVMGGPSAGSDVDQLTAWYDASQLALVVGPVTHQIRVESDMTHNGLVGSSVQGIGTLSAGSPVINLAVGNVIRGTLGGNVTISFSSQRDGFRYSLILKQDATGGRTVAWNAGIKFETGVTVTADTTALHTTRFDFHVDGSTVVCYNRGTYS